MNEPCRRWAELSDRLACEEELRADELDFLERHVEGCDECARERALWHALEAMGEDGFEEPGREPPKPASAGARRPWPFGWAVAGAAAAAAAGMVWTAWEQPPERPERMPVAAATASAPAPSATGWSTVVATGSALPLAQGVLGPDVSVPPGGHVCLRHASDVVVCAAGGTRAELLGPPEAPRVKLHHGHVVVELEARRRSAGAFAIEMPEGRAVAVGTMYSVQVGEQAQRVSVTHGEVRLERPGQALSLKAGEAWRSQASRGDDRAVKPMSSEEMAQDRWLLRGALLWKGGPSATLRLAPTPECAPAVDGQRLGDVDAWLRLAPGARRVTWQDGCDAAQDLHLHAGAVADVSPRGGAIPEPARATPSAAALLQRAQEERARGSLDAAAGTYAALVARYPRSAEASVGRVSLGQLQLQRGRPAEALKTFDGYGGGALGPEALLGKIRALEALGREGEAQAARKAFVLRYPNSVHADAMRKKK